MNVISSKVRRYWKSARLCVGYHRDPDGKRREQPHVWSPKKAHASIHRDADEQEVFIVVNSTGDDRDQDIQIKLRPDMIVLRRDFKDAWQGVKIGAFAVSVKVGGISVRVNHDGSITREDGECTTWVEAYGSVLKKTGFVDATMSGDGVELTRKTPENIAAICGPCPHVRQSPAFHPP